MATEEKAEEKRGRGRTRRTARPAEAAREEWIAEQAIAVSAEQGVSVTEVMRQPESYLAGRRRALAQARQDLEDRRMEAEQRRSSAAFWPRPASSTSAPTSRARSSSKPAPAKQSNPTGTSTRNWRAGTFDGRGCAARA